MIQVNFSYILLADMFRSHSIQKEVIQQLYPTIFCQCKITFIHEEDSDRQLEISENCRYWSSTNSPVLKEF